MNMSPGLEGRSQADAACLHKICTAGSMGFCLIQRKFPRPREEHQGDITFLPRISSKAQDCNEKSVRIAWRQCNTRDTVADDHGQAQREVHRGTKISIINNLVRRPVSEIKLIRTDTTLDLSQKGREAEEKKRKGMEKKGGET